MAMDLEEFRRAPDLEINYEKTFISCLESRILWLKKQLEQKRSIIEKLLITNCLILGNFNMEVNNNIICTFIENNGL